MNTNSLPTTLLSRQALLNEIRHMSVRRIAMVVRGVELVELSEIHQEFLNWAAHTRNEFSSVEEAWRGFIGPHQKVEFTPIRCRACNGKGFDVRHVARNMARTGSPVMCGECRGSRRGTPVSLPARPLQ